MSEKRQRSSGRKPEQDSPEQEAKEERVEKEIDPAQGEIIDAEVSEPTKPASRQKKSGGAALIIALLALVVALAAAGFGYQKLQGLEAGQQQAASDADGLKQQQQAAAGSLQQLEQKLGQQKSALDEQVSAMQAAQKQLAAEREQLKGQGEQLQQTLKEVYARVGRSTTSWMAAEAGYLMRIANHRLQLEQDVDTAVAALEAADQRLRDSGDPGWIGVRKQLADEITALKAVPQVDRVGLSARFTGLSKQVADLQVLGTQPMPPELPKAAAGAPAGEGDKNWKTLLKDGWEGFKSVMVIRHRGKPVSAMLPPEQQFFVYQNLRLKLEAARVAVLRGDQALYDGSITSAREWLLEFFDAEKPATQALAKQLDELKSQNLSPKLPDISASLVALNERLKQKGQGEQQ